jgi:plasmid rolling circle replication initiator protein Rep
MKSIRLIIYTILTALILILLISQKSNAVNINSDDCHQVLEKSIADDLKETQKWKDIEGNLDPEIRRNIEIHKRDRSYENELRLMTSVRDFLVKRGENAVLEEKSGKQWNLV